LLDYLPDLGVFVPKLSRHEVAEIYELREMLECSATVKVCGNLTDETLDEMAGQLEKGAALVARMEKNQSDAQKAEAYEAWLDRDIRFHWAYLQMTGNRSLVRTIDDLRVRAQIVSRAFNEQPFRNALRTQEEHGRFLAALRAGDVEAARQTMAEHIRSGCRLALGIHDAHYMSQGRPYGGVTTSTSGLSRSTA
jgi:DNA-binding GntR family transcriptional regulator